MRSTDPGGPWRAAREYHRGEGGHADERTPVLGHGGEPLAATAAACPGMLNEHMRWSVMVTRAASWPHSAYECAVGGSPTHPGTASLLWTARPQPGAHGWPEVQVAKGGTLMHHVEERAFTRRADVLHTSEDEARYYFKVFETPPPLFLPGDLCG